MGRLSALLIVCAVPLSAIADEQEQGLASRLGFFAGMGVSYSNPQDVVDYVNTISSVRVADFKTGVEFYGGAIVPVSEDWVLKLEYSYLLGSYNTASGLGPGSIAFHVHMPSAVVQYVAISEPKYNLKLGAGAGLHIGVLTTTYGLQSESFTGSGLGTKVEVEANTAFSEHFFGYIAGDFRWVFIGEVSDQSGKRPPTIRNVAPPTLHFFGVSAKLGVSFYI